MSYLKTSHQTTGKANLTRDAWNNPLGAYSKERAITALLIPEKPSVGKVFEVIVSQAFTRPYPMYEEDGRTVQIWSEGIRPWSLRGLAAACNLCVNTIRYALWRLTRLGLIAYASSRIGTAVRVLNFFRFRRETQVGVTSPPTTRCGDTPVSKNATYRIPLNENSITVRTSVAVSVDESAKNFRISDLPSDTRADLAAFKAKNRN